MVVVRRSHAPVTLSQERDLWWDDLLARGTDLTMASPSAEDLLMVLYTSGTTGQPKGILHSHCGFPVKAAQDMAFGTDVGPGTRISWVTDLGWMMGPWLVYGALILGGTIVLYDGAPDYPGPDRLWQFCANHKVEVLGISPTLVRALAVHGDEAAKRHDLSALRIFGSTGEPWNPEPWWWLFDKVGGGRAPIINYSGGTEISGGILMGNPLLPVKPCSFPAPCPGIAADVVDDQCRPVRGTVGELVIRKPWIGMAQGLPARSAALPRDVLVALAGRVGARRLGAHRRRRALVHPRPERRHAEDRRQESGPAEIESVLVSHASVVEAAAVGVPHQTKGNCLVAFCVLANGRLPGEQLAGELSQLVAAQLGKPLKPDRVIFVPVFAEDT